MHLIHAALRQAQEPHFGSPLEAACGAGTGIRQSAGTECRHKKGGGRLFCKVKCQLGQIPNQVRDDGLRWGWLASLGVGAFTDSGSGPGMTAGLLHRGCFRGYTFCAALRQGQGPDFDASLRLHCGFRRGLVQDSRVEPENDTIAKSWNDVLVLVMMEVGFYSALRLAQGPGFDARWRLRCEFQGPGDFGITVFFVLGVTDLLALRSFAPLGALLARSVNFYYSDLEQTTR